MLEIAHRIAIAGTLGAAWALARFAASEGRPALPVPEEERAALAPLPKTGEALSIWLNLLALWTTAKAPMAIG